jgi:thiol-disulfide isomerase/thioredoxin
MRQLFLALLFIGFGYMLSAQQIQMIDRAWIKSMRTNINNDTTYVINFWATWCKPCVEELPIFEKMNEQTSGSKVKILLVSNDMKRELNGRLPKFIQEKNIRSQVLYMNEINANDWIELINTNWSGAIPATWIIKPNVQRELFHEGELTFEELTKLINQINKQ